MNHRWASVWAQPWEARGFEFPNEGFHFLHGQHLPCPHRAVAGNRGRNPPLADAHRVIHIGIGREGIAAIGAFVENL